MKIKHTPVMADEVIEDCVGKTFTLKGINKGMALLVSDEGDKTLIYAEALCSFTTCSEDKGTYREFHREHFNINKLALSFNGYAERLMSRPLADLERVTKKNLPGKTTAKALEHIVKAIQNPGVAVELVDNHTNSAGFVNGFLMRCLVDELIAKLEFKFMVINSQNNTLTFEI